MNQETVAEIKKMGGTSAYAYKYVDCFKLNKIILKNDRRAFLSILRLQTIKYDFLFFCRCDVTNREEVLKVAERVTEEVGNVTILINNAGIMPCHAFLDYTPEEIRKIFDVNVLAHFWVNSKYFDRS